MILASSITKFGRSRAFLPKCYGLHNPNWQGGRLCQSDKSQSSYRRLENHFLLNSLPVPIQSVLHSINSEKIICRFVSAWARIRAFVDCTVTSATDASVNGKAHLCNIVNYPNPPWSGSSNVWDMAVPWRPRQISVKSTYARSNVYSSKRANGPKTSTTCSWKSCSSRYPPSRWMNCMVVSAMARKKKGRWGVCEAFYATSQNGTHLDSYGFGSKEPLSDRPARGPSDLGFGHCFGYVGGHVLYKGSDPFVVGRRSPALSQCNSPSFWLDPAWTSSPPLGPQKASQTQSSSRIAGRDRQKSTGCEGQLGEGHSQSASWPCCRDRAFDPQAWNWHAYQHLAYGTSQWDHSYATTGTNGSSQPQCVSRETFVGVCSVALARSLQLASRSWFFAWQDARDGLGLGHRGLDRASLCISPCPCQRSPAARVGRDAQQPCRIGLRCLRT